MQCSIPGCDMESSSLFSAIDERRVCESHAILLCRVCGTELLKKGVARYCPNCKSAASTYFVIAYDPNWKNREGFIAAALKRMAFFTQNNRLLEVSTCSNSNEAETS